MSQAGYSIACFNRHNDDCISEQVLVGVDEATVMRWFGLDSAVDTYCCLGIEDAPEPQQIIAELIALGVAIDLEQFCYDIDWVDIDTF